MDEMKKLTTYCTMRKLIIILLLLPLLMFAQNPTLNETWYDMNGEAHFIFSTGMALGACSMYSIFLDRGYAELAGITTVFSVGLLWELNGNMNPYDLMWDFVGAIVGTGIYILIDRLLYKEKKKVKYY